MKPLVALNREGHTLPAVLPNSVIFEGTPLPAPCLTPVVHNASWRPPSDTTRDFYRISTKYALVIGEFIQENLNPYPLTDCHLHAHKILPLTHSGSTDCTVKIWDPSLCGSELRETLKGHTRTVRAISSDRGKVVSGSDDQSTRLG